MSVSLDIIYVARRPHLHCPTVLYVSVRKSAPYAVGEGPNTYSRPSDRDISDEAYASLAKKNYADSQEEYMKLKSRARAASSHGVGAKDSGVSF